MYLWGKLPVRLAIQCKFLRQFNLPLLATTCESVWPGLYSIFKYRKCLPWNGFFATCVYLWGNLPVRLATQRKSLPKFNLPLLATTCESVWPRFKVRRPIYTVMFKPWSNGPASSRKWAQVGASWRKLNLRRDLHWVAKRTGKFPHKYTRVVEKNHFKADISCISLANNRLMDATQLASTWVGWPNGEKGALTCVQIWSRRKWAQVVASLFIYLFLFFLFILFSINHTQR